MRLVPWALTTPKIHFIFTALSSSSQPWFLLRSANNNRRKLLCIRVVSPVVRLLFVVRFTYFAWPDSRHIIAQIITLRRSQIKQAEVQNVVIYEALQLEDRPVVLSFNYETRNAAAYKNSGIPQPQSSQTTSISTQLDNARLSYCWFIIVSLRGIFRRAIGEHLSVFRDNTAHAQKLLFLSFRSTFWHDHYIQRSQLPIRDTSFWRSEAKTISGVFIFVQVENMLFSFLTLCKNQGWVGELSVNFTIGPIGPNVWYTIDWASLSYPGD